MRRTRLKRRQIREEDLIVVGGVAPNPAFEHELLPDMVVGFALDQRAFGPRQLMVAFAAYDGRFLALLHARRTDPVDRALEACLQHFDALGRGGETHAAAVALCDEPVTDGPAPPRFLSTFERARTTARRHGVHLVDWIGCDDELIRFARGSAFAHEAETEWWDVPDDRPA